MRIHCFPTWFAPGRRGAGLLLLLLTLCLGACSTSVAQPPAQTPTAPGNASGQLTFPTTAPQLRRPDFGSAGQVAPTLRVLPSVAPSLILQFPLAPASLKKLFPNAAALVTVVQGNPELSVFDTVIVDVQHLPPGVKFTVFFTELAAKPFGHAEYVGDLFTRGDGSGESIFHLITLVAFAADNRRPGISNDQSGEASGIQLEHVGMWFDTIGVARQVLGDPTIVSTPFDGGHPPQHSGPQAMTDGQSLPVI
ncbi:MAG TPA: hypothetical protein VGF67_10270 [Ktedonobacteraceae bacterium]|jgi:hypothetical protein